MHVYFSLLFVVLATGNMTGNMTQNPGQIAFKDIAGWIVTGIPASIAAIVAAVGVIYTGKSFKLDANAKFMDEFLKLEQEIQSLEKDPRRGAPKDNIDRKTWEYEFVNKMDRILWLIDLGKYNTSFVGIVDECKTRRWTSSNLDPSIIP
jgi:hypothetical protein